MKHMKHWLATIAVLLCSLTASAEKVEIDGIWYNLVSKAKTAEVTYKGSFPTSYDNEYSGSIIIPATVTYYGVTYSVTSIEGNAFSDCSSLTTITIPEGVTNIGEYAFEDCSSLIAININESVTSIGNYAFDDCTALKTVIIEDGSTTLSMGYNYDSMYNVGEGLFYDCPLKEVYLGRNLSYIAGEGYGYSPFYNKTKLKDLTIGDNVTSIGRHAFYNCSSLTGISIPECVTSIEYEAFSGCSSLTSITLPEGVTSIGQEAFAYCRSLTAITIPEGVTSIEYEAFSGCSSLTTIVLSKNLRSMGSKVFSACHELIDVYCNAETMPSTGTNTFSYKIEYATLHVPANAIESYKSTAPWSSFGTIVPLTEEKVTSITLSHTKATLTEGQTLKLIATVEPGYATDKTLIWSCTDFDVAAVDNKGKVTAIAPGTATIIAKASDGSGVSAQCEVTVEAKTTEVEITISQYGSGTYCSPYALDFSNVEGLKAYAATGYNELTGVVTLTRVMTTKDGVGLFIKGEPGEYMVPIMENSVDNTLNMLVGTLAKTSVNATSADGLYANYKYTIKEGNSQPLFYRFTDGSTLGAGKAYLQIPMAWLPQTSEAKSISLRFDEGEGTTDIANSQFTIDNSQLTYDLFGRRVDNPVKGDIYIVNGKKVIY